MNDVKKFFTGGSLDTPSPIITDGKYLNNAESYVGRLNNIANNPVTGANKTYGLTLADLEAQRAQAQNEGANNISSNYANANQAMQIGGGQSLGTMGRLRNSQQRAINQNASNTSLMYSNLAKELEAQNIAGQEGRQLESSMNMPQYQTSILNQANIATDNINKARMAEWKAQSDKNANKKSMYSGMLTAAGTIAGGVIGSAGGPLGTLAGAAIGGAAGNAAGSVLV